jgi:predicted nucleic acid-binding protein
VAIIVSDTSPLRALAHLGHLDLLEALYQEIVVPPAVARELLQQTPTLLTVDVSTLAFVRIQMPSASQQVQTFKQTLDAGESEALALAIELRADLVLLDEKRARAAALHHSLSLTGTLGILIEAKRRGMIPAVRPLMEKLLNEIKFFVSQHLRTYVLQVTGE